MSERVPEGWVYRGLEDCLYRPLAYGVLKPESFVDGGIPLLRIQDVSKTGLNRSKLHRISKNLDQQYKRTKLRAGDLIISLVGTIGRVLEIPEILDGANISRAFGVIGLKEDINRGFIYQVLISDKVQEWIKETSQGNAQKVLNLGSLKELEILYPPLPEQKKIASILTSVDEVIENTQKQIDKLQDLKKATMNELLTKGIGHTEFKDSELGRIPKSWEVNELGDYVKCQGGNAFPSSEFGKIGIPVVRISNIKNGLVDLSKCVHFSESEQFERFIVFEGEILLAMSGATTGKIGVYKAKSPAYLNQRVGRFRIEDKKNVDSAFLNHLVQSEIFADATLRDAIGGAQPNISSSQVESVIYAFPTLSEQKVIASILNSVDHKIDVQNAKLNQTQSLKKSLMQDLLTGKVRVQVN